MTPEEEARLAAIERRLDDLAGRLERLENGRPKRAHPIEAAAPPVVVMPPRPPARTAHIETAVGLTWISRIAVITVALALAFFFDYAFENHWISETGRVLLGLGCGVAALTAGERLWRGGQRAYAQSLTAAGIAFFYLSLWAGFALYHLMPQAAAFGAMLLATAASGALALRYDAPAVALLGLAGGFATPLLLGASGLPWFVLGYALVLDGGAAWLARARGWRWQEALAVAGTLTLYLTQSAAHTHTPFVVAYYALFAASRERGVRAAAQLLAGATLAAIWAPSIAGLLLALAIAVAGLALAGVPASFAGFWLGYAAWYPNAFDRLPAMAVLTAAFLLFLGWGVWRAPLRFSGLLVMALNTAFYFGACYGILHQSGYGAYEGMLAVGVAMAQAAAARALWGRDARGAMLAAGAAWVMLVLAAPIQFAGYRITIAWAAEGAAVVWLGTRFGERRAFAAGAAVFVLVLARLAWIDERMFPDPTAYTLLINARFLAFAVSAAALWAAAWWVRNGRPALAAYTTGHAVLLWGLALEAVGWAARTSTPRNFQSVASTSISVLAALYAVLLVAGGAAARSTASRVLGVGLIGLVVLKLYLYDVWLLGQFYRMTAFAILGILLLAMSYLYSRRRER